MYPEGSQRQLESPVECAPRWEMGFFLYWELGKENRKGDASQESQHTQSRHNFFIQIFSAVDILSIFRHPFSVAYIFGYKYVNVLA